MSLFLLYETSLGYTLFEINGYEEIQQKSDEFQQSVLDYKKVSKIITLKVKIIFLIIRPLCHLKQVSKP